MYSLKFLSKRFGFPCLLLMFFHMCNCRCVTTPETVYTGHARTGEVHASESHGRHRLLCDSGGRVVASGDNMHACFPTATTGLASDGARVVYPWPGIEGVLESYMRHREGAQNTEVFLGKNFVLLQIH